MTRTSWFLLAGTLAAACSSEPNHPPQLSPKLEWGNPVSCTELPGAVANGSDLYVDGGLAGCSNDTQECPLSAADYGSRCPVHGTVPWGMCSGDHWQIQCITITDAGTGD